MTRQQALDGGPDNLDRRLLEEAADWLVVLQDGAISAEQRRALDAWRARSPEHERVWHAARRIEALFDTVPADIARPVLGRERFSRRDILGLFAALGVPAAGGWLGYRVLPWRELGADYRTRVGARVTHRLPDGSRLTLNTDTAVDRVFDAATRRLRLYSGEILVETAPDPSRAQRPFVVDTPQGRIRALGTRFTVRTDNAETTRVGVIAHAVAVRPAASADRRVIEAGHAVSFERGAILPTGKLPSGTLAWTRGQLVADNQRLADFVAELARYRSGVLRCDPRVADRRISGVFQLDDSDRVLAIVARTLDLRVASTTGYWVVLEPAD